MQPIVIAFNTSLIVDVALGAVVSVLMHISSISSCSQPAQQIISIIINERASTSEMSFSWTREIHAKVTRQSLKSATNIGETKFPPNSDRK